VLVTTQNQSSTFAASWITNGGSAIGLDPNPNVTPPTADRIIRMPAYMFACDIPAAAGSLGVSPRIAVYLADGTSADVRYWFYDDALAIWTPLQVTLSMTTAAVNVGALTILTMIGAKYFPQITANVGVTKIAVFIR
jgi:hypothetical protein